jgi:hypothetical protein
MSSFSQPSQGVTQSMPPAELQWTSTMDDIALGCECADPALQIAMWGQEAGEQVQAASVS